MDQRMRTVTATRYVTPLREGGSLPAIAEADDLGIYVVKFRGAGQGQRALIAELVAGEIARALGLPVPEIVYVELDAAFGRSEPHEEIRALLLASVGLNLGLDYLPGSLAYDPAVSAPIDARSASAVVWFDALVSNVDRTARNTNMLLWHRRLYLIDHGASLYFHYSWQDYLASATSPFSRIRDHVLLPWASRVAEADALLSARLTAPIIAEIAALIPDGWLGDVPEFTSINEHRAAYCAYLLRRLQAPRAFAEEAIRAHAQLI
jgi:hypothetical protein